MKKITLLLTCALMVSAVPVSAQAKTVNTQSVLNAIRVVKQVQTMKGDRATVTRNILKSLGIDIDKYNMPIATAAPAAKPTAAPTEKPAVTPTQKPVVTEKPVATPTQKPVVTEKPAVTPTQKPVVTEKPAATPTPKPVVTQKPAATPTPKPVATQKPANNTNVSSEAAMEAEVLRIVNEERAKYGLNALKRASDLDALARAHSADMIRRNFFDHTNPDGKSPFDRMRAAGISYRSAAENIAYGQRSAEAVMNAWMNSSGHRKNILGSYTEIGIGAVKSSGGTIYWTREFVTR